MRITGISSSMQKMTYRIGTTAILGRNRVGRGAQNSNRHAIAIMPQLWRYRILHFPAKDTNLATSFPVVF